MATNLQTKVQQAVRLALQPFQVLHNVLKASLFWDTQKKPVPPHSLVWAQLLDQKSYHLDHFELRVSCEQLQSWRRHDATTYLSELLTAFVEAAPVSVGGLMRLRNAIVGPFGLRTSHLGCPVSSLLSVQAQEYFLDRFPVWTQHVNADNTEAQVVLGANDKHVEFRSVVMVEIDEEGIVISLSNRVAYRNAFGHFYMACIKWIHQTYIVPKMLSSAAHRLCAPEQLAKTQHCRCLRSIFG